MSWNAVNPEDFRKSDETLFYKSIILNHFNRIILLGSSCLDKSDIIRFERSIKMLESAIAHRISKEYQDEIAKIVKAGEEFARQGDMNSYYEILRTRFMLLTQEMSFLGYMPEERAIDVIGGDVNDTN